jgi:hypothetical protein
MVSGIGNSATELTGIYTPLLDVAGDFTLRFSYKFSSNVVNQRWVKILLTNGNNEIITKLDSFQVTNSLASTVYTYNKTLPGQYGPYKLYINYQGIGGTERISIDNIDLSINKLYTNGCNEAPVATYDYYYGYSNFTAAGNVLDNDFDPNEEAITAYLVSNSADGTVTLSPDGEFMFVPKPGFIGTNTNFKYQTCDVAANTLCSAPATVTINFAASTALPIILTRFDANYIDNSVTLKWFTSSETNSDRFEIERSIDGVKFEKAGTVKAAGTTNISRSYFFNDEAGDKFVKANDIYYRLNQIDLNGRSIYSKTLIVRVFKTKTLQSVSVFPNPAVNDIKVSLDLKENAYIVMKVIDINGHELMRKSARAGTGHNSFTLEKTSQLKKGVYLLEVIVNSKERMMIKLLKS